MANKIEIYDVKLSRRVDDIVSQLREAYPDGKVSGLNARHKTLSNKVGEIWQIIGYETRDDFFAAYGFEFVRTASGGGGGRPVSVDGEELLAEIASRYEDMPKPKTLGNLIFENPDLKSQLKTLSNKANEVFGRSLAKELSSRGLLSGGSSTDDVSDEDIQAMLDSLSKKYAGASMKPSSISELKADNPEYKAAITAFSGRGKMIYGITPKNKLIELGIYPMPKGAVIDADTAEIENAIDELGEILCDLPAEAKPGSITDLVKAYPKQGEFIKAGKKKGLTDKGPLQEIGILAPTKALLKKQGVRKIPSEELLPLFISAVDEACIMPGDEAAGYLPFSVVGIDAENKVELRTTVVSVKGTPAKKMAMGKKYSAEVIVKSTDWGQEYSTVQISCKPPAIINGVYFGDIFAGGVQGNPSELAEFEGATVVSVSEFNGAFIAQLELNYLAELRSDTMIYVLRQMGIVSDSDVLGGMGWRFRMRKAAKGAFDINEPLDDPHEYFASSLNERVAAKSSAPTASEKAEGFGGQAPAATEASADTTSRVVEESDSIPSISFAISSKGEASGILFGVSGKGGKNASQDSDAVSEPSKEAALEAERTRLEEEKRQADEARKIEEARAAEEEARRLEEAREAEEERKRKEEERRIAEEAAAKQREADYDRASIEMAKGTEAGFIEAERLFRNLKDYEDSSQKASECREQINAIQEAIRKREEEEAEAKAEAECKAKIKAQEERVQTALEVFGKAKSELSAFELRLEKISALEAQSKSIEQTIAGLGFFKGREKKARQQELSSVMAEIAELKKQNLGMGEKRSAYEEAKKRLDAERAALERCM